MNLIVKKFDELTNKELYEILRSRSTVFHIEQQIHYNDLDRVDYDSYHCFLVEDDSIFAYLRAFTQENAESTLQIGRVLTLTHGKGLGKKLMEETISYFKNNTTIKRLTMHAQKHAVGFYEKLGFHILGDEFIEAGIIHITMYLDLK